MLSNAEWLKKAIDQVGRDKVAMLVTDNAGDPGNMQKARSLVVASEGYKHIIELRCYRQYSRIYLCFQPCRVAEPVCHARACRCMMHGFALVIGSLLAHSWAASIIKRAQVLVRYFRNSHQQHAKLQQLAEQQGITIGLQRANTTRFTSAYLCLDSVRKYEPVFRALLQSEVQHAAFFTGV